MKKLISSNIERILFLLTWIVIILSPILNELASAYMNQEDFNWSDVIFWWIGMLPFLIIFLINNFILVPLFFNRHKFKAYILSAIILVAGYSVYDFYSFNRAMEARVANKPGIENKAPSLPPPPPPHTLSEPERPQLSYKLRRRLPVFFDTLLAALVVCFNIVVIISVRYQRDLNKRKEQENRLLQSELKYLRTQLNPHFFMNMLNNIHAMIEIDPERAQNTIIELSKLMRYILYESENQTIGLAKELEFVSNYILLMKQRYPDGKVEVNCDFPQKISEESKVPPLLLMSFVENAFKHGVSYRSKSHINISVTQTPGEMCFVCSNSKPVSAHIQNKETGGVGLENARRRLDILYGDKYILDIEDKEDQYKVNLKIHC